MKKEGQTVKALTDVPQVALHARWLWEAFNALSRKRLITETGPQPISVAEILAYAQYFRIPIGLRNELFTTIETLDEVFLSHAQKQRKKSQEKLAREAKKNRLARRR